MAYHYSESGLDYVWLEDGFTIEPHPSYGELVSIQNVRGLHDAIGRWLIRRPRPLTGAEFRFLRTEMDISQRALASVLGVGEQAIAKWEKARDKPVANLAAERLLRLAYQNLLDGPDFAGVIGRLAAMRDASAEREARVAELHLARRAGGWSCAA